MKKTICWFTPNENSHNIIKVYVIYFKWISWIIIHLPKMKYKKGLFKNKYCLCWYINTFVVLTKSLLRVLSIIFQSERRYFLRLQNEPSAESRFLWNSAEDIKFNIWRSRRLSLLKWFKWSVNRQILSLNSFSIGFSSLCHPGVFIFGIFFFSQNRKLLCLFCEMIV